MAPCRYLTQQPAWAAIKLAALCAIVAVILNGTQYAWVRWLTALVFVVTTRWLSARCSLQKGPTGCIKGSPSGHKSCSAPGTGHNTVPVQLQQYAEAHKPHKQHRDRHAWKRHINSACIAEAWEKLCNCVVQEFIYDSWFSQLSPDREFPSEVRWLLNHVFGQFCRRAMRLDWIRLLVRDCSTALCATLQLYRTAAEAIGPEQLRLLPAAEADAAIRQVLSQSRSLHSAFWTPDGQYRACRCLADAVLVQILPPEDKACPMLRSLLRELFATCLIRSLLASLAPHSVQQMLLNTWTGGARQVQPTPDQERAAVEFQQKASQSSQAELSYIGRQKPDKRSRRSQWGPASFGSAKTKGMLFEVGIKRSKSLGDVKYAGSRSPVSSAAAAAAGVARTAMSVTARQFAGRWRESAGGLQGAQGLMGGVTAVKAAAQHLTLKRRLNFEARLADLKSSAINALGSSPVESLGSESPRGCSALDAASSPDGFSSYKVTAASGAKAISAGGAMPADSSLGWLADNVGDSSWSGPMTAGLSNLGRPSSTAADSDIQHHGLLQAQVVNADMLKIDGKDCIVYRMRVADDRAEWTITRRYRHFEALHKHLKDSPIYRELGITLPPKRLLSARDAPFVMKRREELDHYLQTLLENPYTASDPALLRFLSQQNQAYGVTAASDEDGLRHTCQHATEQCGTQSDDSVQVSHKHSIAFGPEVSAYSSSTKLGMQQQQSLQQLTVTTVVSAASSPAAVEPTMVNGLAVPADSLSSSGAVHMYRARQEQLPVSVGQQVASSSSSEHQQEPQRKLQQQYQLASAVSQQKQQPQLQSQQSRGPHHSMSAKQSGIRRQSAFAAASNACCTPGDCPADERHLEQQQHAGEQQVQQQQPGQHHQPDQQRHSQHMLEQLDSIDPGFCSLQSRAGPSMPSSPPVPNRILPEPSLMMDGTGSVRTPGAPKRLSQQASDAAHEVAASPAAVCLPVGGVAQVAASPGAKHGSVAASALRTAKLSGSGDRKLHAAHLQDTNKQCQPSCHDSVFQAEQSAKSCTSGSKPSSKESNSHSGPLQQGLRVQQAAAVSRNQQPDNVNPLHSSPRDTSASGLFQTALASSSLRQAVTADSSAEGSQPSSPCVDASKAWSLAEELGPADLDLWQDYQDRTGLVEPLYEFIRCAFELESSGFVRRPVFSMIWQLLSLLAGGAIDEFIQKTLSVSLSERNICRQLDRMQAQLFPGGVWFARAAVAAAAQTAGVAAGPPPRGVPVSAENYLDWTPPSDSELVLEQLRQKLLAINVPAPFLALVGKNAYQKAVADLFGVVQSKTLLYNLGLRILETVLIAMFPGIKGAVRQMHQSAV